MDITDTTATSNDVLDGEVFYAASGTRSVGTLSDATQSAHGLMSSADKTKLDNIGVMQGATANDSGVQGLVPAPTSGDIYKFLAGDGTYRSGGLPMVILSYGHSTWNDFIEAYNNNVIVYCRASSNANPASGNQTRMAFMAYINADPPTQVEFQYYRSMNPSNTNINAISDQTFVYTLNNQNKWSVMSRENGIKQVKIDDNSAGSVSFNNNVTTKSLTINTGLPKVSAADNGKILKVVNGEWAVVDPD